MKEKRVRHHKINYVEFASKDLEKTKAFFEQAFGWIFKDYGPDYTSFSKSGLFGGFEKTEGKIENGALVVLYHTDLDEIKSKIVTEMGTITKDVFSFPGGRRFHFADPSGNELAVWSDH